MTNISSIGKKLKIIDQEIQTLTDNIKINDILERFIRDITEAQSASIWIYDKQSTLIRERKNPFVREVSVSSAKGLLYKCFATKESAIYNYLASEKGYVATIDNPDNIKMKSKVMVPLVDNNTFIGILTAYSSIEQIKSFSHDDLTLMEAVAPSIINAIYKMVDNNSERLSMIDRRKNRGNNTEYTRRNSDSINNLKEMETSLSHTKTPQELLDFVANIVHDIRTPSNGLSGFLEIIEEKIEDERLKEYISHAKESALLINELTTSILDGVSSKLEVSQSKKQEIFTSKFFADIAEIFSATMYKKSIYYNIFIDPKLPEKMILESTKLKRVLINLIGNASKFTKPQESIEFSVRYKAKDNKIHIFVKDSGIGIAKDKQEQIFEAFKQAEDDTKEQYGGTGLGLSISAAYVKDLGGKLLIESALDVGSTFYFDIPIEAEDRRSKFKPIHNPQAKITLLMSRHNSFVANHIAKYFVKMGINIDAIDAVNAKEAIEANTTHLIVFEKKLEDELFLYTKNKSIKLLCIEESFLNLNPNELQGATLISQYSYYAEALYSFVNTKRVPKVLIVDDDKIGVVLIKNMLQNELCRLEMAFNGRTGLDMLTEALQSNEPYDIVYADSNMPLLSGEEMIAIYKKEEGKESLPHATTTVSISGDIGKKELGVFDICVGKPFDKEQIRSAFLDATRGEDQ